MIWKKIPTYNKLEIDEMIFRVESIALENAVQLLSDINKLTYECTRMAGHVTTLQIAVANLQAEVSILKTQMREKK